MRAAVAVLLAGLAVAAPVGAAPPAQPKPRETVAQSIFRIQAALRTTGCTARLKALFHSAYGKISSAGCRYLRQGFGTFKSPRGKQYGTGAVIDHATGYATPGTTVLALDADGKFHVVFIDFTYGSIGTKPDRAFDLNAKLAVDAIRRDDCPDFLKVAYRKFGLGGGSDASVCRRLASTSLHAVLAADPAAKPVKLGGNSLFAFYRLDAGEQVFTIVMAQQAPSAKVPVNAARHAFVNAYPAV